MSIVPLDHSLVVAKRRPDNVQVSIVMLSFTFNVYRMCLVIENQ
jgi:hypothetical protein